LREEWVFLNLREEWGTIQDFKKKTSFFLSFKEKINNVANGYKNSRWQR